MSEDVYKIIIKPEDFNRAERALSAALHELSDSVSRNVAREMHTQLRQERNTRREWARTEWLHERQWALSNDIQNTLKAFGFAPDGSPHHVKTTITSQNNARIEAIRGLIEDYLSEQRVEFNE